MWALNGTQEDFSFFPLSWTYKTSPKGSGYSQETNKTEESMQLNVTSLSSRKENPRRRAPAHRCLTVSRLCLIWLWEQSNPGAELAGWAWESPQKQAGWCQHHHHGMAGRNQAKLRHRWAREDQTRVCLAYLSLFFPFHSFVFKEILGIIEKKNRSFLT